jgi:hypothetical protein
MEIFDIINAHLASSPVMLEQLETLFRIKFWLLLLLAGYFLSLPYREKKKIKTELKKKQDKGNSFLARIGC